MAKKKAAVNPDEGYPTEYRGVDPGYRSPPVEPGNVRPMPEVDPDAMMRELEVTDESEHDVIVRVVLSPGFVLPFRYSPAPALKRSDLWDAACNAARLFSMAQGVWFASATKLEGGMPYKLRWVAGEECST